jgi:very-short-patch-repair endonuclease
MRVMGYGRSIGSNPSPAAFGVDLSPMGEVKGGGAAVERFKARARQFRVAQTSAESRLWRALRNRQLSQWKFRRQHPIDRYIVDFVTIDGKLIVEVDGATHSLSHEIARDAERTRVLESFGFRVVRITNIDIYENLDGVLEMLLDTLQA